MENGIRKDIGRVQKKGNFGNEWYSPHHPVLHSKSSGNLRSVSNAAFNYKEVSLTQYKTNKQLL